MRGTHDSLQAQRSTAAHRTELRTASTSLSGSSWVWNIGVLCKPLTTDALCFLMAETMDAIDQFASLFSKPVPS